MLRPGSISHGRHMARNEETDALSSFEIAGFPPGLEIKKAWADGKFDNSRKGRKSPRHEQLRSTDPGETQVRTEPSPSSDVWGLYCCACAEPSPYWA